MSDIGKSSSTALTDSELAVLRVLIPETTTLTAAQDLLRQKEALFSASSWDELFDKRLLPALAEGTITRTELVSLLEPEEHGRQNVFLYRCEPTVAAELMARGRVEAELDRRHLGELPHHPLVVLRPPKPKIVEVRWENGGGNGTGDGAAGVLVLKVVATRVYRRQVEERERNDQVLVVYEEEEERAVHLFRLHPDGLLEVRIQSRRNTSNHNPDLRLMWEQAGDLLPFDRFTAWSLHRAKDALWKRRSKLAGRARFSYLRLRNEMGNLFQASSGAPDGDLAADPGAVAAVGKFLDHEGDVERINLWWLASEARPVPSRDIHTILGGQVHELAITSRRTRQDDAHVLDLVVAHNR